MARLSLTLLGSFQARQASGVPISLPTKKAQALLAYLALRPGEPHPREKLATLLWGDSGEEQARNSLRQALFALRKALPETKPAILPTESETVALNLSALDVDVAAFERLVGEGTPEALQKATALYRGDLLEGLDLKEASFEAWLVAERERLRELVLEAVAKLLAHQTKAGTTEQAIQTAVRLLALDPLQEAVHRTLMRLYVRQARRAAALKQYQACVGVLQRELGVEPEAETKELYQEILQRRALRPPATEAPAPPRAQRAKARVVQRRRRPPAAETPLVAREQEVARLRKAMDEAWQGRGQIVAILGDAGIGKSRLVEEVSVEGLRRGGRVLLGHCHEAEQVLPFGPWVDALRAGQVIADGEGLKGLSPVWQAELARLFPELGEPGLPLTAAAQDHLRLFEAMAHLVEHLAILEPLVVLLEDLHWADDMSLRLLSFLSRRLPKWRVLVVATAREEELAGATILRHLLQELDHEQRLSRLTLLPLSHQDTLTLVGALARAGSDETTMTRLGEQVWGVSEGNPFMVVETIRAFQQGKRPPAPSGLPLPERVREVIAGRLERLGDRSRGLVALAAVTGRQFDFALLESASGLADREAAEGVEELVRRRILHGVGERLDFTHDQIRQVAYAQILPPRRKTLHGLVARALEELYPDHLEPHYAALALHYRVGERPEKAIQYALLAGDVAARRYAYAEAAARYQEALNVAQTLGPSVEASRSEIAATLRLAGVGITRQDLERDRENLERARTLAEQLHDDLQLAQILYWVGRIQYVFSDMWAAIAHARQSLEIAERLGNDALTALPVNLMGRAYYLLSDFARSSQLLERNVDQMRRLGNRSEEATAAAFASLVLSCMGEFESALRHANEGLQLAQELQNPFSEAAAYHFRGCLWDQKGEWARAITDYEEARRAADRAGDLFRVYLVKFWEGRAHTMAGDPLGGKKLLEESLALAERIGTKFGGGPAKSFLGHCLLTLGHPERALTLCQEAISMLQEAGQGYFAALAQRTLGETYSRLEPSDLRKAEEAILEAIRMLQEIQARPELARTYASYARFLRGRGERERSREHLTQAIGMFREMGMAWDVAQAEQGP